MNTAWEANNRAKEATTLIADEIEDDLTAEAELASQAVYDDKLETVGEMVSHYLAERAGDAPSEVSEVPENVQQDDDQQSQSSTHSSRRGGAGGGVIEVENAQEVAKQDPPQLDPVTQLVQLGQGRSSNLQPPVATPVTSFLNCPPVIRGTPRPPAPDEWIDRYVLGFDAAPTTMDVGNGRKLKWSSNAMTVTLYVGSVGLACSRPWCTTFGLPQAKSWQFWPDPSEATVETWSTD
jgi:hypothetical protein